MLSRPRFAGLVLVMLAWLPSAIARAQVAPPPPQDDESRPRIRMGGVSVNPTIALTNIGIDSNVFNSVDDPQSDFTMTLSPGLDLWARAGRVRLVMRARTDLVYFNQFSSERSIDGGFGGRVELPFNRLVPWIEGGSYSGRQRVGYEIDARLRRTIDDIGFGAGLRVAANTRVNVGLRRETTMWNGDAVFLGNNLRQYLSRTSDSLNVSYRQQLTALTTFAIDASAMTDRFQLAPERNADSVRVATGFDLKTRALINGRVRIGYRKLDPVGGGFGGFRGLVSDVSVGYTLRGATRLAAGTSRDTNYSFERTYPYYVQTGVSATVTQRLTDRWDAQGAISRTDLAYRTLVGAPGLIPNRTDRWDQRGGGMGYRLNRDVRIGFNVDKVRRRSPVQRRDYDGYRLGASVTYAR